MAGQTHRRIIWLTHALETTCPGRGGRIEVQRMTANLLLLLLLFFVLAAIGGAAGGIVGGTVYRLMQRKKRK